VTSRWAQSAVPSVQGAPSRLRQHEPIIGMEGETEISPRLGRTKTTWICLAGDCLRGVTSPVKRAHYGVLALEVLYFALGTVWSHSINNSSKESKVERPSRASGKLAMHQMLPNLPQLISSTCLSSACQQPKEENKIKKC
jgi:hypothetical protein